MRRDAYGNYANWMPWRKGARICYSAHTVRKISRRTHGRLSRYCHHFDKFLLSFYFCSYISTLLQKLLHM